MSPIDIFDTMLESIQQFPLECNNFERQNKRLNRDQEKYTKIYEKLAFTLTSPENKKYKKVKRKLYKTIKKRLGLLQKFETTIEKQSNKLEELISISKIDPSAVSVPDLLGNGPAVIKLNDTPSGRKKYCLCGDKAFGTMICCDNPSCEIKWYHLKCVNISTPPKSKWKCSKCSTAQ